MQESPAGCWYSPYTQCILLSRHFDITYFPVPVQVEARRRGLSSESERVQGVYKENLQANPEGMVILN